MPRAPRLRSVLRFAGRFLGRLVVFVLVLAGVAFLVIESGWGKNQLRGLIVRQASQYLTAKFEIGGLSGSLLQGIELADVLVSKDNHPLIAIDRIAFSYSIRELLQPGVVIRKATVIRPRIAATRLDDGRWDLAALVKREVRQEEKTGPRRPFEVSSIEIMDGTVTLSDDVVFGAAHIPTRYEHLDASVAYTYAPVQWVLDITRIAFRGSAPDLTMHHLSGRIESRPGELAFKPLNVRTARSGFTLTGRIERGEKPTALDLHVLASRFAFQEWGGVLHGLRDIAVDSNFDTTLRGPLTHLGTDLKFQSNAGTIRGTFALNTTVPGWLGQGQIDVEQINLAKWMNRAEKVSDITGRLAFDLAFGFGQHFPRGSYRFDGAHAMYMNYAGDRVHARGRLTADAALITEASAIAYGAMVRTVDGSIGLRTPYAYHFPGTIASLDLRSLPQTIPVPHVQTTLALDYDVHGTFTDPFIAGTGRFARSTFLGATIADGTLGAINTQSTPLTYSGDGEISGVDLARFGEGLDVGWMKDPRYAGRVDARFHVEGSGGDRQTLKLTGSGRLHRASMFGGRFTDADTTVDIANGTLGATFAGGLDGIDPSIPFADKRFDAALTGDANLRIVVRDVLRRSPESLDYDIDASMTLRSSVIRGVAVDTATIDGSFKEGSAAIRRLEATGPAFQASGNGRVAPGPCRDEKNECTSDFAYNIVRADLEKLRPVIGGNVRGVLATTGRLTGLLDHPRMVGDGTVSGFAAPDFEAPSLTASYDVSTNGRFESTVARAETQSSSVTIFDVTLNQVTATLMLSDRQTNVDLRLEDPPGQTNEIVADALIDLDRREAVLRGLTISRNQTPWRLVGSASPPVVSWSADGISTTHMTLVGPSPDQQLELTGTWRYDGNGDLHLIANHVVLDTLPGVVEMPARYGGVLNADATIRGTRQAPILEGQIEITDGRIRRFSYQRLAGSVDYVRGGFSIDLRLDQSPGTWIAATGTVPRGLFDRNRPDGPLDVAITSSPIGLGLLEGLTDVVSSISGEMRLDLKAIGTSHDPHFEGTIGVTEAAFAVTSSGSRYTNGRVMARLSTDRIDIDALHLVDRNGDTLDLHGSLGTHELRFGDLSIDATARHFEVLRNEFGTLDIDVDLKLRGKAESPQVLGDLSITGGTLNVDAILERTLLSPYSTTPLAAAGLDVISALNPWDRLALDLSLHFPQGLRVVGDDLQVAQGTPIGLGDVNMRVGGDLYLYKDPNDRLSITGSLDRVSGTYRFQGRRFDIDERGSSINFRGDLNPELYVQVTRDISGVETRVSIIGDLHNPELHLSSTPPLEPSDVLALIVFNAPASALSAPEQQELAVRAATIAAGFFAKPIVSAIERSLGLDILEIEANEGVSRGTRVTIGEEIAPGLVARFSRQFGQDEFNQATVEYSLSRLLRIRATFSDATSATIRSPFRRVERAGVDLLLFFSF